MVLIKGKERCSECNSNSNEIVEKLDKFRYRMRCRDCQHRWIKDETPKGFYGDGDTKRGCVGRPYKGINLDKFRLNAQQKEILKRWA